jgi:ATP-binding cassette subfamily F protein 3
MKPENASNMEFVTEYTTTKKALDEEVEQWEKLSEELESLNIS